MSNSSYAVPVRTSSGKVVWTSKQEAASGKVGQPYHPETYTGSAPSTYVQEKIPQAVGVTGTQGGVSKTIWTSPSEASQIRKGEIQVGESSYNPATDIMNKQTQLTEQQAQIQAQQNLMQQRQQSFEQMSAWQRQYVATPYPEQQASVTYTPLFPQYDIKKEKFVQPSTTLTYKQPDIVRNVSNIIPGYKGARERAEQQERFTVSTELIKEQQSRYGMQESKIAYVQQQAIKDLYTGKITQEQANAQIQAQVEKSNLELSKQQSEVMPKLIQEGKVGREYTAGSYFEEISPTYKKISEFAATPERYISQKLGISEQTAKAGLIITAPTLLVGTKLFGGALRRPVETTLAGGVSFGIGAGLSLAPAGATTIATMAGVPLAVASGGSMVYDIATTPPQFREQKVYEYGAIVSAGIVGGITGTKTGTAIKSYTERNVPIDITGRVQVKELSKQQVGLQKGEELYKQTIEGIATKGKREIPFEATTTELYSKGSIARQTKVQFVGKKGIEISTTKANIIYGQTGLENQPSQFLTGVTTTKGKEIPFEAQLYSSGKSFGTFGKTKFAAETILTKTEGKFLFAQVSQPIIPIPSLGSNIKTSFSKFLASEKGQLALGRNIDRGLKTDYTGLSRTIYGVSTEQPAIIPSPMIIPSISKIQPLFTEVSLLMPAQQVKSSVFYFPTTQPKSISLPKSLFQATSFSTAKVSAGIIGITSPFVIPTSVTTTISTTTGAPEVGIGIITTPELITETIITPRIPQITQPPFKIPTQWITSKFGSGGTIEGSKRYKIKPQNLFKITKGYTPTLFGMLYKKKLKKSPKSGKIISGLEIRAPLSEKLLRGVRI